MDYRKVNVASQVADASFLCHSISRMIHVRKIYFAFGYGSINLVETNSPALEYYCALIQLRSDYSTLRMGDVIMLKSNKPSLYTALQVDGNGIFLILANLSKEAIDEYSIPLNKTGLVESAYRADQADGQEINRETLQKFKPFENLHHTQCMF